VTWTVQPVGFIHADRSEPIDDRWDSVGASIELLAEFDDAALDGLDAFSHAEILFLFHGVHESDVEQGARHPRGNTEWPRVGIFAQRARNRPNRIGATIVRVLGRDGRTLRIAGLDAVDGTPVLDIKPVLIEFLPRTAVYQPKWATELMRDYW
jgi:tRNA (adenine37-N6)-methyltransferase